MIKLKDTPDESLRQSEDGILVKSSQELPDMFLATKRLASDHDFERGCEPGAFCVSNKENGSRACISSLIMYEKTLENGTRLYIITFGLAVPNASKRRLTTVRVLYA